MKPLFLKELRGNLKALLVWCAGIVFLIGMGAVEFSAGAEQENAALSKLMDGLPKIIKVMTGMSGFNVSTLEGYYGMLYLYVLLIGACQAVFLGAGIISKEERDKTADFLYTKPLKRNTVITAKLLAAVGNVTILAAVTWLSSKGFMSQYDLDGSFVRFILIGSVNLLVTQFVFLGIGFFVSAVTKTNAKALAISGGITMFAYILYILVGMSEMLEKFIFLTPIRYFDFELVLRGQTQTVYYFVSALIVAVTLVMTYVLYNRRNIKS